MKRRSLLKSLAAAPLLTRQIGDFGSPDNDSRRAPADLLPMRDIYEELGVHHVINARGTVTIIGATRILPEVEAAMQEATKHFVQLDELMKAVSERIGRLTGAESGIVTTGATGALTVAAAGMVTGGDPDKLWKLPEIVNGRDEVIIPAYSWTAYESAVRGVGVRMIEVSTISELKTAINIHTAFVLVLASEQSERGELSTAKIAEVVRPLKIPILVDAAAEGLEQPNPHLSQGADLVAYSGGKYLNGPQCAGILIGRKSLVDAAWLCSAPHHGWGRGYKVGREEIVGMLTAVEMWWKRDHNAERDTWQKSLEKIGNGLQSIRGVTCRIVQPRGRSNPSPDLQVRWDEDIIPMTGFDVENLLWDANPRIAVSGAGSYLPFPPNARPEIMVNSSQLSPGDDQLILGRLSEIFSHPLRPARKATPAQVDISGKWKVIVSFAASNEEQRFVMQQHGDNLAGVHTGAYGDRELLGTVSGNRVLIRSAYRKHGVRLNYEFTGTSTGKEMAGQLSMGEYGVAGWRADKISSV